MLTPSLFTTNGPNSSNLIDSPVVASTFLTSESASGGGGGGNDSGKAWLEVECEVV